MRSHSIFLFEQVKGPPPTYQTPLRQPAVKGRPAPQQVTQAPHQEEEPQFEVKGQRQTPQPIKSPQRSQFTAAALQSTPSVSTTTILYDERATYTAPASSTPSSRTFDDEPNADIGFDDEGTAFSEEDMPSKMPLDDESDYPSANLKSNFTVDEDDEYNKPRTVPSVRSLPLSPANKARRSQAPGDRDNIDDDASPNDAEVERDDSPFETTVAPVSRTTRSRRPSTPVFGERIRELPRTEANSYVSSSLSSSDNNNNNLRDDLREYASTVSKETVSSDKNEYADFEDPVPDEAPAETFEEYVDTLDAPQASSTTLITEKNVESSTEASNLQDKITTNKTMSS